MVSHALSIRRSFTPKTAVCFPPPPPPVPPELPPRTCEISPSEFTLVVEETEDLELAACCPALPVGQDVAFWTEATGGVWDESGNADNCDVPHETFYEAPAEPGDYTLHAHFTWSDGGQCDAYATAHVEEENGDNGDE